MSVHRIIYHCASLAPRKEERRDMEKNSGNEAPAKIPAEKKDIKKEGGNGEECGNDEEDTWGMLFDILIVSYTCQ